MQSIKANLERNSDWLLNAVVSLVVGLDVLLRVSLHSTDDLVDYWGNVFGSQITFVSILVCLVSLVSILVCFLPLRPTDKYVRFMIFSLTSIWVFLTLAFIYKVSFGLIGSSILNAILLLAWTVKIIKDAVGLEE